MKVREAAFGRRGHRCHQRDPPAPGRYGAVAMAGGTFTAGVVGVLDGPPISSAAPRPLMDTPDWRRSPRPRTAPRTQGPGREGSQSGVAPRLATRPAPAHLVAWQLGESVEAPSSSAVRRARHTRPVRRSRDSGAGQSAERATTFKPVPERRDHRGPRSVRVGEEFGSIPSPLSAVGYLGQARPVLRGRAVQSLDRVRPAE